MDAKDTNDDTVNEDLLSRGISLGPTNITEGASMDVGDASQWNTGGAISVKDKVPPVINEGEQQLKAQSWSEEEGDEETSRKNVGDNMKPEDSGNLSGDGRIDTNGAEEPHEKVIPTPSLLAPEGIEGPTTTANDYDNEEGHPHNKDGIVSTAEELSSKEDQQQSPEVRTESNHRPTISPTPSQITQRPEQDLAIQTTNVIEEEVGAPGSSTHVASAATPMSTNKLHQVNTVNGFDAVDVANGAQTVTAGHKAKESGAQVAAKDQPHGATNEDTSHVRSMVGNGGENAASVPAASNANNATLPDAVDASKGGSVSGVQTTVAAESQDKAISHGTDSPSHPPAALRRDILTQTIPSSTKDVQTSEADVSNMVTTACTDADCSAITQGDRQKTQPESAVNDDKAENLDISQSSGAENYPAEVTGGPGVNMLESHSLHAPTNTDSATVSYDEEGNQNSGLPSSSLPGSKHEESNVNRLESEGMIGMKSGGMGSLGDNRESALMEDSSTSQSRRGTGESSGEHCDTQRNGMQGMLGNNDPQGHIHTPPGSSHSLDSPEINRGDVTLDNSRRPTSPVTDDLPKTTDGDSLNVSRASGVNCSRSPGSDSASHGAPRNVSLTENSVNASLSTQQSLTDTQPQTNGSLANQNASLGAEETPAAHPSQTQHRDDLEANGSVQSSSSNNGGASPTQNVQQGQQGDTTNQAQNSSIPPLSAVGGGGGNGNGGGGGAGGHGAGSSGRDREKSVFLRLSNQIQELEMNMSLLSSYLDQISTRLVNS